MKSFVKSQLKPVKEDVKALTTALDTTTTLAKENQGDVENLKTDLDTTTNLALGNQGDVENLKTSALDITTNLAVEAAVEAQGVRKRKVQN